MSKDIKTTTDKNLLVVTHTEKSILFVKMFYERMVSKNCNLRVGFSSDMDIFNFEDFQIVVRNEILQMPNNSQGLQTVLQSCYSSLQSIIEQYETYIQHFEMGDASIRYVVGYYKGMNHYSVYDDEYFDFPNSINDFEHMRSFYAQDLYAYCKELYKFLSAEVFTVLQTMQPENYIEEIKKHWYEDRSYKLNFKSFNKRQFIDLLNKLEQHGKIEFNREIWGNFIKRNILFNGKPSDDKEIKDEITRIKNGTLIIPKGSRVTVIIE